MTRFPRKERVRRNSHRFGVSLMANAELLINKSVAAVMDVLFKAGILARADRENRRLDKQQWKYAGWRSRQHSMNGEQEMARRRRQIAAGSLTVANGLAE